jgi:hypothetical protein
MEVERGRKGGVQGDTGAKVKNEKQGDKEKGRHRHNAAPPNAHRGYERRS